MKRLLLILILTLSFQTLSKADDISDFEIEGMSVGDSALKYFKKDELINEKTYYYKDNKYAGSLMFDQFEIYDDVSITFDPNDKNLILVSITGEINFKENIEDCYKMKDDIVLEIKKIFPNLKEYSYTSPHGVDKTGNSVAESTDFDFENGDNIRVYCMDWSNELTEKNNWWDTLKVSMSFKKFTDFITNEAYK